MASDSSEHPLLMCCSSPISPFLHLIEADIQNFFLPISVQDCRLRVSKNGKDVWNIKFSTKQNVDLALEEKQWKYFEGHGVRLVHPEKYSVFDLSSKWDAIHQDLQLDILSHFDVLGRCRLRRVCTTWNAVMETFWDRRVNRCLYLDVSHIVDRFRCARILEKVLGHMDRTSENLCAGIPRLVLGFPKDVHDGLPLTSGHSLQGPAGRPFYKSSGLKTGFFNNYLLKHCHFKTLVLIGLWLDCWFIRALVSFNGTARWLRQLRVILHNCNVEMAHRFTASTYLLHAPMMEDIKKTEEAERRSMVQQFGVIVRGGKNTTEKNGKGEASDGAAGDSKNIHAKNGAVPPVSKEAVQEKRQTLRKALRKMGVPLIVSDETSSLSEEDGAAESRAFLLNLPHDFTEHTSEDAMKEALVELDNSTKAVLISCRAFLSDSSFDFFELVEFVRDMLQLNFTPEYRDVESVEKRRREKDEANESPTFSAENLVDEDNDTPVVYEVDPFHPLTPRQIWIEIPLDGGSHPSAQSMAEIQDEAWRTWSNLENVAEINPKLGLCLRLDNTFSSNAKITQRWFAERLRAIVIPSHIWKSNKNGYPILPALTKDFLIRSFHHPHITYLLETPSHTLSTIEEERLHNCFLYLLHLFKEYYRTVRDAPRQRLMRHLANVPIRPLQPLRDHLTQEIYEVFEADPIKYRLYNSAMFQALKDWRKKGVEKSTGSGGGGDHHRHLDVTGQDGGGYGNGQVAVVVAMVVGAGRGPLVSEFISAAVALDLKFKVYALDKNPIAIGAMLAKLEDEWASHTDSIHIVQSDMRDFEPEDKADMIISELLGSFGCNELSPECLDGAQRLLKPGGISIPYAYSNFLQPVMARSLYEDIATYAPKHKNMLNEFILAEMRSFVEIAPYQEAFTFVHPNYETHSNERDVTLRFTADIDYVMTGLAGYFDLHLYKDVSMNILPDKQTMGLSSWFPAFFALERPVPVTKGQQIVLHMGRRCDVIGKRVWYVWNLLEPEVLPVQNASADNWISM